MIPAAPNEAGLAHSMELSMEPLSPEGLLQVWERGAQAAGTRRALEILSAGLPGVEPEALAALPLGRRERLLLELRARTLGGAIECTSTCPRCEELLEVSLPVEALVSSVQRSAQEEAPKEEEQGAAAEGLFRHGALQLELRLPTSEDLLAAEACAGEKEALRCLVGRCVVSASRDGESLELADAALTDEELAAAGEHLSTLDPLAETLIELQCAACGHGWTQLLDVAETFYAEVGNQARRLLLEVAWLARGYGWSEAEILALSPHRRRSYLELLLS